MHHNPFLSRKALAERWGVAVGTLANQVSASADHPPYVKIGNRILYPLDKLVEFENARLHRMPRSETEAA